MAELSEVESVLVSVITQALYPNGTGASSATGDRCKIYRGWPIPANLDADMKSGFVNVSVFPMDAEQNVTRYSADWLSNPTPPITLTMTVSGQTVTVGGTPRCPLNAAILVNGKAFIHPLQATDTPTSIATALAALINTTTAATSLGPVVTVPGTAKLDARIGAVGTVIQELKRQKKSFRITIWCNHPLVRDAIAGIIDPALASLTFLSLTDGTGGRIRYDRTHPDDSSQKSGLYRRDLVYSVEYGTTRALKTAEVVSEVINISGGQDGDGPVIKTINL
jgi:hypothetical protein